MKHIRAIILAAVLLLTGFSASAETETKVRSDNRNDPAVVPLSPENTKSGWRIGVMPAFSYNNDMGFLLGVLTQVYDYGDGTVYPNYRHKFMANVNIYSRGAKQVSLDYDSKYLIPGKRLTVSLSYMDNPLYGFYGFNGAVSPYYADLDRRKSADGTDGIAFYANHQRQLSTKLDLQGRLADHLTWIGGGVYSLQRFSDTAFRIYDGTESLFHQYLATGLIPAADTWGHRMEIKGGLVYDTRDFETNPERGIFATVTASGGMSVSEGMRSSLVLSADFRHYIPVFVSRLTLAYQLAYKGLVTGSLPFYALPAFAMRGSFGNRIMGNGVAWASADLRLCIARFQALRQNYELGLVAFSDAGAVVQSYKLSEQSAYGAASVSKILDGAMIGPYASIYDRAVVAKERLHSSAGGGFWFSLNKNFLVAIEVGHPLNPQDGTLGIYINLGFSF